MATFDASKIRAGQLFKKNATSFSPTQQPSRSYSQIFSKLFAPTAPAATSTPRPQSIQSPFVQNAPITPLGQIGAKLPVGAQDVSPGVNAQAGLANAVQKQMQPAASAIAQRPALSGVDTTLLQGNPPLPSPGPVIQTQDTGLTAAQIAAGISNPVSTLQVQPASTVMGKQALSGVDTTLLQDKPPLPRPGPVIQTQDTGLTAAQIAAGIGDPAYQAYLRMGGTLSYDAWRLAMSNQEDTTTTDGTGDTTKFPKIDTFIPNPNDPRLLKIAAYYDEAGKSAIEENNQAAAAMANRMRQTGGTGTMFTLNAALTENADNLLSENAKTRAATAVAKAQALAQTTLEIANQNFENALNVANYLPEDMRAGYMGSIFEAIGQHLGLSPEQIAAAQKIWNLAEWSQNIQDQLYYILSVGNWTESAIYSARAYLEGVKDIDGNPLSPEAIDAIITTAQPEVPVVTTTSTGRGDNTSRTFTTTSRT